MTDTTEAKYTAKDAGNALLQTISSACKTPILTVKYCNLLKPFYYANCRTPRYSITCIVDPRTDSQFIDFIQTIEKNENIENALKPDNYKGENGVPVNSGNYIIKFQTRLKVPVKIPNENGLPVPMILEDDFASGEKVTIIYDVLRYTKRGSSTDHGLSFKPTEIIYHQPEEGTELVIEG